MSDGETDPRRIAFVEFRKRCFMGAGPFVWAAAVQLELRDLLPLVVRSPGFSLIVVNEGIVLQAFGDSHHVSWAQLTPGSVVELHAQMVAGQAEALRMLAEFRLEQQEADRMEGGSHALH